MVRIHRGQPNISLDKVTINFQDIEKEYKIGDLITGEIDLILEYLKKVTPVLNSLTEKWKETVNLIAQAKTAGNIKEILTSGRDTIEVIKEHKQQLLSVSMPSNCKTSHSLILEGLQLQEDTQNPII